MSTADSQTPVYGQAPDSGQACTQATERCEFWTWQMDYLRPACCTSHLMELLCFTADLFARHGIFYWLDFGSLLGAVRSSTLIPWDEDIDISCWKVERTKILALKSEIQQAGYWLNTDQSNPVRIQYSQVNTQHVDVWLWWPEDGLAKMDYYQNPAKWYFPTHYLEHLAPVSLYDHSFPAPAPVGSFLARRYGPDYLTPRRHPASYSWSNVPIIRGNEFTPLVEYLLNEIRIRDYCIVSLEGRLLKDRQPGTPAGAFTGTDINGNLPAVRQVLSGRKLSHTVNRWLWRSYQALPPRVKDLHRPVHQFLLLARYTLSPHPEIASGSDSRLSRIHLRDFTPTVAQLLYEIRKREYRIKFLEAQVASQAVAE